MLTSVRPTTYPLDPCLSWLVRMGNEKIGKPLRDIINLSLVSGTFPEGLKEAVVQPLLKKPLLDLQDPANYRQFCIPGPKEVQLASTRARAFSALAPA